MKITLRNLNGNGKTSKAFPDAVKRAINDMARGTVKSFNFRTTTLTTFYTGEGYSYKIVRGDAVFGISIVSNDTIGGGDYGRVNEQFRLQIGDWLIQYYWYGGLCVIHIVPEPTPSSEPKLMPELALTSAPAPASASEKSKDEQKLDELRAWMKAVNLDELRPIEALNKLHELKRMLGV